MRAAPVILVSVFAGSGCLGPEQMATARDNSAPIAALRAPVVAPVGEVVTVSAEDAFDPDADILTYIFQVGGVEATESPKPVFEYTFAEPGLYTVSVRVVDLHGVEALAKQDVTALADYPAPPDFCGPGRGCVVGDECVDGVCFSTGGAVR